MPKRLIDLQKGQPLLDIASYGRRGPGARWSPHELELITYTARRTPEVVVKVSGGAASRRGALAHLTDLRLAPCGREGKFHDGQHRNPRALIAMREVVAQLLELAWSRPPSALARLPNQAQLRARIACLLDDLRPHGKLPDALGSPEHDPHPVRSFATVAGPAPLARRDRT